MKKEFTTGKIGEKLFKDLLNENNVSFINLQRGYFIKNNQKFYSHPFDFVVGDLNIEIKTSRDKYNEICFSWFKNDKTLIDYIIGLVIDKENNFKYALLFDKEYINYYRAYRSKEKDIKLNKLDKKDIISLSTGKSFKTLKNHKKINYKLKVA